MRTPELEIRGWTKGLRTKYLSDVEELLREKRYGCGWCSYYFYPEAAVAQREQDPVIAAALAKVLSLRSKRSEGAKKAVATRIERMEEQCRNAELTIKSGWSEKEICNLASETHGGNYAGDPGEFNWSNRTARNCIRHNLTNYEELWALINRGETSTTAYQILRSRVDALINKTYPQFRGD